MKTTTEGREPLATTTTRKVGPDRDPMRYRVRVKRLFQRGGLPRPVKRYFVQAFPRMCGEGI